MVNRDLRDILKEKPEGEVLLHEIKAIKNEAISLLERILITFDEYTPHDINHSETVLTRINLLIPDSLKEKLNSHEIYFLIISAYLHDLGMAKLNNFDIPENIKNKGEKLKAYIRDCHHIRSENYIIENYEKLKISNINQARIIGKICRGHRKESLDDKSLFDPKQTYMTETINVPFLASILRVADELDLTFERIPLIVYEMGLIKNPKSKLEWETHLIIDGVDKDPEGQQKLRCTATCKDPQIHRALRDIEYKINYQLDDLHDHLYHYRSYSKEIPRKFELKINAEGYTYYDFKFSLKENEILKLLTGEGLYKRNEDAIRELLKNCVDTCRHNLRVLRDESDSSDIYEPRITFELTPEKDRLVINDNGVGMDEYIIENYFTKIGRSFYISSEFQDKEYDFSPVGELGIGFLSCFMIADKIEIETKTDYSKPLFIEIDNISNYFLVKDGNRRRSGTKITLYLKENAKKIDIEKELKYYARHLEIPINIRLPSGEVRIIENMENKPFFKCGKLGDQSLFIKSKEIKSKDFEGTIGVLFGESEGKFNLHRKKSYMKNIYNNIDENMVDSVINYNGVLICNMRPIPEWLNDEIVFQDINIKEKILDLNLGRNQIKENEKFLKFLNTLEELIVPFLTSLPDAMEIYSREELNAFITGITDSGFNYRDNGDSIDIDELRSETLIKKDILLLDFLKKFYSFTCFSENGYHLMGYEEVSNCGKKIKVLKYCELNSYIQEMLFNLNTSKSGILYIMLEDHDIVDSMITHLFGPESINFYDLFEMEPVYDLRDILPYNVNVIRLKNINTDRLITHMGMIEDDLGEFLYVNIDNNFMKLIFEHKDKIYNENRNLLKELFRYLLQESNINMMMIHKEQLTILKWFEEKNVIDEEDFINYQITQIDLEGSAYPFRTGNML